ncbi:hypothetical protein N9483_01470 [Flavobacteriaceae bacterium]|nr:hypothetical protein [Flavobacteriaceae bacterium]
MYSFLWVLSYPLLDDINGRLVPAADMQMDSISVSVASNMSGLYSHLINSYKIMK